MKQLWQEHHIDVDRKKEIISLEQMLFEGSAVHEHYYKSFIIGSLTKGFSTTC